MNKRFKVKDEYRHNALSRRKGGYTLVKHNKDGSETVYDKIKYPPGYADTMFRNDTTQEILRIEVLNPITQEILQVYEQQIKS